MFTFQFSQTEFPKILRYTRINFRALDFKDIFHRDVYVSLALFYIFLKGP